MIVRVWLAAATLLVAAAWLLMVPGSPPAHQQAGVSMIEQYRASGLMPPAGALRVSEEIGHEAFEVPAADAHSKDTSGITVLAEGASAVDRTVEISMHEWGYQPEHVTVRPGEVIRLAVRHAGSMPHEFMLMTGEAMNAVDYRLQRADWSLLEHRAIFEKSLILPGDRFEVVLKVEKAGMWMFMCMLPYHMQLGMMGMLMTPGVPMDMSAMGHGRKPAAAGPFEGEGTVIAVVAESGEIVLDHGEIKGLMGAMTMGYPVASKALLQGLNPGDTVKFKIDPAGQKIIAVERLSR